MKKQDAIFLDKTGTITSGKLTVVKIIPDAQIDQKEILSLAGSAEKYSDHPLAKPVLSTAIARGIPIEEPKEFSSDTGRGVRALVQGASIYVGRLDYMRENNFAISKGIERAFYHEEKQSMCMVSSCQKIRKK